MGIFDFFTNIFESIFKSSSPEFKKKQALQKIDSELKKIQPSVYKSGMLQPNFPELFRILYENTAPIEKILSATVSSQDVKVNYFYERKLFTTGFSPADQEKLENLTYDHRKSEALDSDLSLSKVMESQHHTLDFLIRQINTQEFIRIDEIIGSLQQLTDICRFNYLSIIHNFDPEYNGFSMSEKPNFVSCVPSPLGNSLQDFYYITANFKMTSSLANAVLALEQLRTGKSVPQEQSEKYMECLKKINSVLSKYLTPDLLKKVIILAKKEPEFSPQTASYNINARQRYVQYLQQKFDSDTSRIKTEIKDNYISVELKNLFNEEPLLELNGYNSSTNKKLRGNCNTLFNWIMPLEIIKTFMAKFFDDDIKNLLNDIVIEGFFNTPTYKTDFSSTVYACLELPEKLENFEDSFNREKENDQAILESYIQDSHKDSDFSKKLSSFVDNINGQAKQLVQDISTIFFSLYKYLEELIIDAKKTKPDMVSNIKVLLTSSRNRERSNKLELQFEKWTGFLEIMKNYAIIGEVKRK